MPPNDQNETRKIRRNLLKIVILIGVTFSVFMTGLEWLRYARLPATYNWLWDFLHLPAFAIWFILFAKLKSATGTLFFLCVFVQWLLIGLGLGYLIVWIVKPFSNK